MPRTLSSRIREWQDARREYRADYEVARPSRFRRTRSALYGTADAHYAGERAYFEVIEYVRDMERNDPLIGPTLDIVCNQTNKGGFQYAPDTGDEKLDADLKADFDQWGSEPGQFDHAGELSFRESELLTMRSEIRDGDCFVIPTVEGRMQFLEAERCRTPVKSQRNIIHGIELNRDTRRRVKYWFTRGKVDISDRIERTSEMVSVEAVDADGFPQVFHVYGRRRLTQTRGVSAFTAAQLRMGMLEDVEFALLVKQQMASTIAWSEETEEGGYAGTGGGTEYGARETVRGASGGDHIIEEIAPGMIVRPAPGKRLRMHAPQVPSTETMEHMRRIIQLVGLQVGLPVIMLLMDARETNFSGWRGAVEVARSLFRQAQEHRRDVYHRRVAVARTRWLMAQRNAMGRGLRSAFARIGPRIYRHKWRLPSWPYIQPLHDAQARALKLSTLQTSPRREAAEDGQEWDEVVRETVADNEAAIGAAIDAAARLNLKAGANVVHWTHLLNRDMPKGVTVTDSLDQDNAGRAATSAR